jgi:hypothetical protein
MDGEWKQYDLGGALDHQRIQVGERTVGESKTNAAKRRLTESTNPNIRGEKS